ncbi:glycosyltransferase family 2 protein [candidate division KSB1 bacterium]|nr:glycosyltransferase family 2 protein [candidate division KSB1 bacterium]
MSEYLNRNNGSRLSGPESVSVVVPCYNESGNIQSLCERTLAILKTITDKYEIILVNDGSSDSTLDTMILMSESEKNIEFISFSRNFGHEAASTAGLEASTGEVTVLIDADLQDPPELIRDMIEKWKEGNDIVYAVRKSREGESIYKKLTSHAFYKVINSLSKPPLPVDTGDYRLIDRKALDAFKKCREVCRFVRGLSTWVGFKQTGILYDREKRHKGKSKYNYIKLSVLAIEAISSFSLAPLRFSLILGGIGIVFALLLAIVIILQKLFIGNPVQGYVLLMLTVLFMGSMNILLLGFVAEYVGKIFLETQKRPLYIVEKTSKSSLIQDK